MGCLVNYFEEYDAAFIFTAVLFCLCAIVNCCSELVLIKNRSKVQYENIPEYGKDSNDTGGASSFLKFPNNQ